MTKTYFPFDSGAGSSVTEAQWRKMAALWLGDGVIRGALNELAVSQRGAGANKSVDVASGRMWINGHYFESDAVENLVIADNTSGNPRIDRIIVRADFVANTVDLAVLQGTPAVSPSAPALTQTTSKWELSLAQVAVANGFASIVSANITDERPSAVPRSHKLAYNEFTASVALSATTEATANTIATASAVTCDGSTPIEIEFGCARVTDGAAADGGWALYLYQDGSSIGNLGGSQHGAASYVHIGPVRVSRRFTPTAGSHTYSIRGLKFGTANETVEAGAGGSGANVPGYIKVVIADA